MPTGTFSDKTMTFIILPGPSLWKSLPAASYGDRRWHYTLSSDTQGLSVPHLMCQRTERTSSTARRCCGVFCDSGAGY